MAFIKVDKKNIYYEEYGDRGKPTIVYLHGGPGESCLTYSCCAPLSLTYN